MSLIEKAVLFAQHGDIVARAKDPDTHEEFPSPSVWVKMLAAIARTPWAMRQFMKWVSAGAAIIGAWVIAHGGSEQSGAIVAGAVAAAAFLWEQAISWLCNKAKISPPSFDDMPEASPPAVSLSSASPFATVGGFARPSLFTNQPQTMSIFDERAIPDREPRPPTKPIKPPPLGQKGCKIIAESKTPPRDITAELIMSTVHGTLRAEADDGSLVIIATENGVRTLERDEWDFYVKAE